jgi:hypothetical protein
MFPSTQVHDDLVDALAYVSQLVRNVATDEFEEEEWVPMDSVIGY